jgi:hypothetical protein
MPRSSAGAWANSSPVNQFPGRGAASSNSWAVREMDCRELSAGMPHLERETSLDDVLAALELLARRFREELERGRVARVTELVVDGVRVAIMPTAPTHAERTLDSRQSSSSFPPWTIRCQFIIIASLGDNSVSVHQGQFLRMDHPCTGGDQRGVSFSLSKTRSLRMSPGLVEKSVERSLGVGPKEHSINRSPSIR